MLRLVGFVGAAISLLACLLAPLLYFLGTLSEAQYKNLFFVATVGWFVFAFLASSRFKTRGDLP